MPTDTLPPCPLCGGEWTLDYVEPMWMALHEGITGTTENLTTHEFDCSGFTRAAAIAAVRKLCGETEGHP